MGRWSRMFYVKHEDVLHMRGEIESCGEDDRLEGCKYIRGWMDGKRERVGER